MCFSAEASFAAGVVLLPAGIYCARIAARKRPAHLPLAVVPLAFAFQQFAEGFVWIGLARGDDDLVQIGSLSFLAFALGVWPFWAPLSVLAMERERETRRWLGVAALLGLALGATLYLTMALNAGQWLRVQVVHHSIIYNPDGLPVFGLLPHECWDVAYGGAVVLPFFLAPAGRRLAVFRILLVVSAVVGLIVFKHTFVSVWCFFAAVLSAQLCSTFSGLDSS